MVKHTATLFVGGPWHGTVHPIPSDLHDYRVVSWGNDRPYGSIVVYSRRTFVMGATGIRVMALGYSDHAGNVLNAMAGALGLEILNG